MDLGFTAVPDRVRVESGAGDPTIEVPAGNRYRVSVDTDTGWRQVDVAQDADGPRTIDVQTTHGDVQIRYSPGLYYGECC